MDFTKIQLINYNSTKIKILNYKMEKIFFDVEDMVSPFGSEDVSGLKYINWDLGDKDMEDMIRTIEDSFKNEYNKKYDIDGWEWISAIRKRQYPYTNLFRTKLISDKSFKPNMRYSVKLTIDSIWIHKKTKTYGLLWITS